MRTCPSCRGLVPEADVSTCAHCRAPLPRMRFRLHPASVPDAEADDAPAAAPATGAPASPSPSTRAPRFSSAAPARAPTRAAPAAAAPAVAAPALVDRLRPFLDNRRLMVAAVVVLVVLLGSGTAAYMEFSPTARYPERYLVGDDEMPAGLRNAEVTAEVRDDHDITENPGRMSESQLEDVAGSSGIEPEEGWVQLIGDGSGEPVLVLLPLRFDDEETADKWVRSFAPVCTLMGARIYQHGSVAVLLAVEDDAGLAKINDVARVLLENSRLERAC